VPPYASRLYSSALPPHCTYGGGGGGGGDLHPMDRVVWYACLSA
jgi:hypothetical protein